MDKFVKLSRAEMKKILGGKGEACQDTCTSDADCNGAATCKIDGSTVCPYRKSCTY